MVLVNGQSGYFEPGTNSTAYTANLFVDPADHSKPFGGVAVIAAGTYHSLLIRADGASAASGVAVQNNVQQQ